MKEIKAIVRTECVEPLVRALRKADLDAYQAALQQAADQMVQAHVAMARSGLDARATLQPDQRTKLDEMVPAGSAACPMTGSGGMMGGTGVGGHARQQG
jgi:hypothetical protein